MFSNPDYTSLLGKIVFVLAFTASIDILPTMTHATLLLRIPGHTISSLQYDVSDHSTMV